MVCGGNKLLCGRLGRPALEEKRRLMMLRRPIRWKMKMFIFFKPKKKTESRAAQNNVLAIATLTLILGDPPSDLVFETVLQKTASYT